MRCRLFLLGLVAALVAPSTALAVTVYRCGADGRTFSQTPCRDSDAAPLAVDDSRDASQRAEAHDAARRTASAADTLAATRRRQEATGMRVPAVIPVTRGTNLEDRSARKRTRAREREDVLAGPFKGAAPPTGRAREGSGRPR